MASTEEIRQRQIELERQLQDQEILEQRQQDILERSQDTQPEQPQIIANELYERLERWLAEQIFAGITATIGLVVVAGNEIGKGGQWVGQRVAAGIDGIEKEITVRNSRSV
jgi:hypothetical protein